MQNLNFNVEVYNKHKYKKYSAKNGDRILAEIDAICSGGLVSLKLTVKPFLR